jgi:hypothetical protein
MINALILTTLPHYLTLLVSPTPTYSVIIFCSTTLSVAWHYADEPVTSHLGKLDHAAAALWFAADLYYFSKIHELPLALILNGLIAAMNVTVSYLDQRKMVPYYVGHSVWHIFSAIKSVFLAYILKIYTV